MVLLETIVRPELSKMLPRADSTVSVSAMRVWDFS